MRLHHDGDGWVLWHGDCREVLAGLPDCSVDSVVTDPPYGLSREPDAHEVLQHWLAGDDYEHRGGGFMGKSWDSFVPGPSVWREVFRVLKPGGHMAVFGGTRTYDLLTLAIRLAGFEIRDSVHWIAASGFPKSLDVSKAIDKMDARDEQEERRLRFTRWVRSTGVTSRQIDEATGTNMGGHYTTAASQPAIMTREHLEACRHLLGDIPAWVEAECDIRSVESKNFAEREVVGSKTVTGEKGVAGGMANGIASLRAIDSSTAREVDITAAATDAAKQWQGWGTALKPAHEPIVLARKPLGGTVAANVLEWGTGALNIDGTRVPSSDGFEQAWDRPVSTNIGAVPQNFGTNSSERHTIDISANKPAGRWPANVIFDGEAGAVLDEQSGVSKSVRSAGRNGKDEAGATFGLHRKEDGERGHSDTGGASRFFTSVDWNPEVDVPFRYVPKPSKRERNAGLDGLPVKSNDWQRASSGLSQGKNPVTGERSGKTMEPRQNHHPTVKPLALMRWLVRLITPPGGTVLEPFAGSGTTLMAAIMEHHPVIGIELTDDYLPIIEGRVGWAFDNLPEPEPEQEALF